MYRVGREPDPFVWPDWASAGPSNTFANRYDDPEGIYRVLYVSSQRIGAYVETLARYRPAPDVYAAISAIDGPEDIVAPGVVPKAWRSPRMIGEAMLAGEFADVGHSRSLGYMRSRLAPDLAAYGLDDLDASTIRLQAPRRLTQRISRLVYECSTATGKRAYTGIYYRSRLGDEFENWAIFEPAIMGVANPLTVLDRAAVASDDPGLCEALSVLGLRMPGVEVPTPVHREIT